MAIGVLHVCTRYHRQSLYGPSARAGKGRRRGCAPPGDRTYRLARRGMRRGTPAYHKGFGTCALLRACDHRSHERPPLGRFHRLRVQNHHFGSARRPAFSRAADEDASATVSNTAEPPAPKVPPGSDLGREVLRQHTPLAASAEKIEDRIDHGAQIGSARSPTLPLVQEMLRNQRPMSVRQVRRIAASCHVMPQARQVGHGLKRRNATFHTPSCMEPRASPDDVRERASSTEL